MNSEILDLISDYFAEKISKFGDNHKGVDWNSAESQELRFQQLCRVINRNEDISVLDFGCGYGALLEYLNKNFRNINYTGLDISETMIDHARANNGVKPKAHWKTKLTENECFDYTIASGIFNLKFDIKDDIWLKYVLDTLDQIDKISKDGFAFNILTTYSDKELLREDLYYANPAFLFDYCKQHYSKYVALIHDYPLYEFTILVKKALTSKSEL